MKRKNKCRNWIWECLNLVFFTELISMFINLSLKNTKVIIASKMSPLNTADPTQTFRHPDQLPYPHTSYTMSYNIQRFSPVRNMGRASAKKAGGNFLVKTSAFGYFTCLKVYMWAMWEFSNDAESWQNAGQATAVEVQTQTQCETFFLYRGSRLFCAPSFTKM